MQMSIEDLCGVVAASLVQGIPAGLWLVPHALELATLALTLQAKRGIMVSAETRRRWLDTIGWVWKRPKRMAKDDDSHRVARLARMRWVFEQFKFCEAMVFADELDIQPLPSVNT